MRSRATRPSRRARERWPRRGRRAGEAFLLANDGKLDASKVGDYLGGRDAAARETARLVIGSLSLRGIPLDGALRLMISFIKLPGE